MLHIYTDGACSGNPGPGAWAYLIVSDKSSHFVECCGYRPDTTNNRMEMLAVIRALESLKKPTKAVVLTDSAYVMDGATKWIYGWKRRGWVKSDGAPVKNETLWRILDKLLQKHSVTWRKVKGHTGVEGNERADCLARDAVRRGKQ